MKKRLRNLTLGALLCAAPHIGMFAQQVVDISTGMGASGPIGFGSYDDTWKVKPPGTSAPTLTPYVTGTLNGGWATSSCSRWITTTSGTEPSPTNPGDYVYTMQFTLEASCTPSSATINITRIGGDNNVTAFLLNNNPYPITPTSANDFNPLSGPYTAVVDVADLQAGTNTVTVVVNNTGQSTYVGLNICGNITINFTGGNLTPGITGASTFCAGAAPTFTGTDGPTSDADNFLWESVECNAAGVPVPGASPNNSTWYQGSPGSHSFPAGSFTCGKYYRIRLAASNECTQWSEATKVVYITCPPTVDAGKDKTVCNDDCVLIGTPTAPNGNTYQWIYFRNGQFHNAGSSSQVMVCPGQTTTYTLLASPGGACTSGSDAVTVTVIPNRSDFSTSINTSNPGYFTVTATPNDVNGFSQPGFFYHWVIEEMNGSSAYYYNAYSNCWWTYPGQTFMGYVSTGTGTYTQSTTCTSPPSAPVGRFLYNHTYRITLATWNDYCPWEQTSVLVTWVKSLGDGTPQPVVIDDPTAPDFSFLQHGTASASVAETVPAADGPGVFPNPSTGLFTVTLSHPAEGTVDVFDMQGKKVHAARLNAGADTYTLDLTGFAKGVYVLNINTAAGKQTRKIVLE